MEKVALYACFRTHDNALIEYHLKQMKEWCLLKKYNPIIYLDKVKSRLNIDSREEMQLLKNEIRNGEYSKLIINDLSQLSSNAIENVQFLTFLDRNNCKVESIDGMDLNIYKKIVERFNKNKEEIKYE